MALHDHHGHHHGDVLVHTARTPERRLRSRRRRVVVVVKLSAACAMSERTRYATDPYGHAAAAVSGMEIFDLGSRRTGRTTRLLDQVQNGDRIICLDRDRRHLQEALSRMGKARVAVESCAPEIDAAARKLVRRIEGRTFVDHEWSRAFFGASVARAQIELTRLLEARSRPGPNPPQSPVITAEHVRDFAVRHTDYSA